VKVHREIEGEVNTAIIMKDARQWFIPLSVGEPEQRQQIHGNGRAVGVDFGITNAIALSDGTMVDSPAFSYSLKRRPEHIRKAWRRGRRVIVFNLAGTSQKCSGCREMAKKSLSERTRICPRCGLWVRT
jgi:transposase